MRRALATAVAVALLLPSGLLPSAAIAAATPPRASFTDIENDVMCVLCHEPLAVAQSPEAFQERDYIRGLILQGKTKREIESDLVQQYGPAVLAKPPAHGFNLLVYVIPPVLVVLGLVTLAVTLPKWRRRTREATQARDRAPQPAGGPRLTDAETRRLDEELARDA